MEENNNNRFNLIDLLLYFIGHWYWFALCLIICLTYTYFSYSKKPFVYRSEATIIIKDPSNTRSTVHLDNYSSMINHVSLSSEILKLTSKQLMGEVTRYLNTDISYTVNDKFRSIELYDKSPVKLYLLDDDPNEASFKIDLTMLGNSKITILAPNVSDRIVSLGDTVAIGHSRAIFKPTKHYTEYLYQKISVKKIPAEVAITKYLSRLKVTQKENEGSILTLSLQDYSLNRASDILNTLVERYNDDAVREKNRIAVNTASFINDRLGIIQEELGQVEESLAKFKSREKVLNIEVTAAEYLSQSQTFSSGIISLESRIRLVEYLQNALPPLFKDFEVLPEDTGIENGKINAAISEYNTQILLRDRLVQSGSVNSPAVKQMEQQLIPLQNVITTLVKGELTSLEGRRNELAQRERESLRDFTKMPTKAREMLSIERQQKIKEELYIFLLNKREENALTQSMVDNNARMVDSASGSLTPIFPSKYKMFVLALIIGLMFPAIIMLLFLCLDSKLRSRSDLEAISEVPFLAEIPQIHMVKKKVQKKGTATTLEYSTSTSRLFKEAMRMMCTNIDFSKPEDCKVPVIMTCSMDVGVGKSLISRNIAACLVDAKKKVIVVDVDLRKRTLTQFFDIRHKNHGLSNYLVDPELTLEQVLIENVADGIDFIPAGHIPPNPTELLSRKRMDELVNILKDRYDFILFDGTPVNMVADSYVLTRLVDMNLFVVRCGITDKRQIRSIAKLCSDGRLRNLSLVLNGLKPRYGYGYRYGYYGYYGYGHGYTSK